MKPFFFAIFFPSRRTLPGGSAWANQLMYVGFLIRGGATIRGSTAFAPGGGADGAWSNMAVQTVAHTKLGIRVPPPKPSQGVLLLIDKAENPQSVNIRQR